ncbi:MAG: glycosyltransferase involved in cell wall biosynthesis [Myxococcales bacterium]|nr:glycosyltransferase involved in cell wall biosynthesis [Myxococcales bacterium]
MTTSKIHVLFAIPSLDRGGPDRVMFEILSTIDRTRFVPSLMVTEPGGHYLSKLPKDIPVEVLGGSTLARRYPVVQALRFIRKTRPDVVFATLRMNLTLGMIAPLLPRGTRLVLRPASPVSADFSALMKNSMIKHRVARQILVSTLRRADAVVCQSLAMQADLGKLFGGTANLHVVANPIDVTEVTRAATATKVALRGRPALVSVARLVPLKGYDVLLRALVAVRDRHPDVHLTILGEGAERDKLETIIRELGLTETVTLTGYVTEPLPYVRAADLFVLTSHYDAFCNAALEALACGTPVVLTDCPGANSELVSRGLNGQLVPTVDPAAIAASIELAIAELASYDRERIQADIRRRYASGHIVNAYERVLASVTEARLEIRA